MKKHAALKHLKQATDSAHQAAEKSGLMQPLMSTDVSKEAYLHALNGLYYWLDKYEVCLQTWLSKNNHVLPEYVYQARAGHIVSDIHELGGFTPPPQTQHERATSVYQALGYAYVIEGSTQGGRMLSQRLDKLLQLNGSGLSYFNYYQQGSWQRFVSAFDSFTCTRSQLDEMTAAALSAFHSFTRVAQQMTLNDRAKVAH
ncbi:heme oxygenase [Idiomarina fontislapidosi]|uniref:Heme oxygenase n=1 Tax=Idiomarina fontislapidosi TaxID=263723 RepID=A0A432YC71_9GAMM|nr:biliverdin-producing heme oxygenase [Idiomarina fontislapidosi]PYE35579.1 heme oxygenase [Idiomarina fontislapidosi]RUO58452.1 hypothetical protein CWE25_02355 [Idiomarina fontislapidosi]